MFGKSMADYLRFERGILAAILVVGLVRLVLSLGGVPVGVVKMFSVTVLLLVGGLYAGIAVAVRGFGGYRHLLPLLFFQSVVATAIIVAAIGLAAVTGKTNVYTAPEYTNLPNYLPHALGHLAGIVVVPLLMWPVAAAVMWATRAIRGSAPPRAQA